MNQVDTARQSAVTAQPVGSVTLPSPACRKDKIVGSGVVVEGAGVGLGLDRGQDRVLEATRAFLGPRRAALRRYFAAS
jgi:hypothetical protein